jgi:hypothetical protein
MYVYKRGGNIREQGKINMAMFCRQFQALRKKIVSFVFNKLQCIVNINKKADFFQSLNLAT